MNNKKLTSILMLIPCLLVGCRNATDKTSEIESSIEKTTIAEEDKVKPTSSDFKYIDHALDTNPKADFDKTMWYRNDLSAVKLPDPDVIKGEDGKYYVYGTTDRTGSQGFDCYDTDDFNKFNLHMNIYPKPTGHWAEGGAMFAPEIRYIDGTYYLYYSDSAKSGGRRSITVLTSDNPSGPFVDYIGTDANGKALDGTKEAIFKCIDDEVGLSVLDQTVFTDDDGQSYMFWSVYQSGVMQYIKGAKMLDPVTLDMSTSVTLVVPGSPSADYPSLKTLSWEAYQGFRVAEGPYMIKSPVNGKYYLTYSVNHYPDRYYTVCYAESDSPLGEYKKPYDETRSWELKDKSDASHQWTNVVLGYAGGMSTSKVYSQWEGFMSGTAHHCFFKVGDEYMIGYHAHINRNDSKSGRAFGFDYLNFDPVTGAPFAKGPSYSIQPLPEEISGYKNIAYGKEVITENITDSQYLNDKRIVEHYNLPQEANKEAKLGSGKSYAEIDFGKECTIVGLAIYNSADYEHYLSDISYISFGNGNVILDTSFRESEYVDFEKEFIRPCSSFTYQFKEIKADKVVIGFDTDGARQINDIEIYGKE